MIFPRQWPPGRRVSASGLVWVALGAMGLLLLPGCAPDSGKTGGAMPAAPVVAGTAVQKDVPVSVKVIGTVEAYNTVSVKARVGGELTRVAFTEGQDVRKGDLLFTLDPRPYQAALQLARADSARDAARAASAEADARRYADLVQKDYVTKQEYDQITASAKAAMAVLEGDRAGLENARLNLDYCFIRAPIDGRTGSLLVHQGNLVRANDDNPLVVIRQDIPVYVTFSVPEQRLAEIRRYAARGTLRVSATLPSEADRSFEGELSFINNTVDAGTGTVLLKATFPNADRSFWPGQFVNVSLLLAVQRGAIVIPTPAVQTGQQGAYVFLIEPDLTVAMQPVTPGPRLDGETVIEKGVEPGDRVVTDGQLRLVPGAKVEIAASPENGGLASR